LKTDRFLTGVSESDVRLPVFASSGKPYPTNRHCGRVKWFQEE
jgi:hypothetical protein